MSSPSARGWPSSAPVRCVGAMAVVWATSFALYPLQLTALAAAVWIVATLVLVPIGTTLTDRIVGLLLLGAAPAVLIAWFTPFLPWLVSAPVLSGLLGTMVAVAWGLGWTRPPVTRVSDVVTIAVGGLTAAIFWLPFAGGGLARAVGILSAGYDTYAHYFMWLRVWANHGYLLFNTLPDPDAWGRRTYPQGAQALLADFGSVLTGDSGTPPQVDQSVALFAILVCLQVGALALVTAWSVDRLSRSCKNLNWRRVVIFQILAALLVAVGPGSVASVQSLSFTTGLVVVIPALALAATARRSPRRDGLLIGASLIAAAAIYPICALLALVVWPLYLWTSRRFWLAGDRRRWYCAGATVVVALLCAPPFLLLLLRNVDHGWNTWGYFQVINGFVYAGIAIMLALLIVFARGRLPRAVEFSLWAAAVVSFGLVAKGILEWLTAGEPSYYTIKTMYAGWMLSVIAVSAGMVAIRKRRGSAVPPNGVGRSGIVSGLAVGVFAFGSALTGLLLVGLEKEAPEQGWSWAISRELWVMSNAGTSDRLGSDIVDLARAAAVRDGATVVVPCLWSSGDIPVDWALALNLRWTQVYLDAGISACPATAEAPLGNLPEFLKLHPEVKVNALTTDQAIYEYALRVKDALKLSNLEVVPPPGD